MQVNVAKMSHRFRVNQGVNISCCADASVVIKGRCTHNDYYGGVEQHDGKVSSALALSERRWGSHRARCFMQREELQRSISARSSGSPLLDVTYGRRGKPNAFADLAEC
jgi:hypothetical protein